MDTSDTLDSQGNFTTSFNSYTPTNVGVSYNSYFSIVAHPGDSIYMEFDGSSRERNGKLTSLKFSGDGAKTNQDIVTFDQIYLHMFRYWQSHDNIIKDYDEVRYVHFIDSLHNVSLKLHDEFIKKYSPDKDAETYTKMRIDAQYYTALGDYPSLHRIANNLTYLDWNVPISYYDPLLQVLPIKKDMLIAGNSINSYIQNYNYKYARKKTWHDKENQKYIFANGWGFYTPPEISMDSIYINGVIAHTPDTLFRQLVLTNLFSRKLEKAELPFFEKYKLIAETYIKEPFLREPLFKQYDKVKEQFENPQFEQGIELKTVTHLSAKQIIDEIIQTNKGNVIYLDCWATWCGPCKAEMPNSKKLMKKMNGNDVAFVYLCLDSEEKLWKASLAELQLTGQHYFLTKEQSTDIRKVFEVNGIPHYFLIDKKGIIVEKGSHLRPNNVKDKIEKLLKE